MRLRRLIPVVAVAVGGWVAWGLYWGDFRGPITDAEARGFLKRIVAAARAKDFEALCGLNSSVSRCRDDLEDGGCPLHLEEFSETDVKVVCGRFVPPEPPVVVAIRPVPAADGSVGGRTVLVRGTDARREPHETEVFVFWAGHDFKATNAVYWSGNWIAERSGGQRDLTRVKPIVPSDARSGG